NDHVAHQHQAVDIGIERTDTVRQGLGQHGNDPPREIHAGSALERIGVDGIAGAHVMADVGDGDQQSPTRAATLFSAQVDRDAEHRIVEVACVFTVDRDEGVIEPYDAVPECGGGDCTGQE